MGRAQAAEAENAVLDEKEARAARIDLARAGAGSSARCVAGDSNSRHQLLLKPADRCPVFSVWTTQGPVQEGRERRPVRQRAGEGRRRRRREEEAAVSFSPPRGALPQINGTSMGVFVWAANADLEFRGGAQGVNGRGRPPVRCWRAVRAMCGGGSGDAVLSKNPDVDRFVLSTRALDACQPLPSLLL